VINAFTSTGLEKSFADSATATTGAIESGVSDVANSTRNMPRIFSASR
jgi:hypothetical protein